MKSLMDHFSLAGDGAGYKVSMESNHCIKRQSCPGGLWRTHIGNADGVGNTKSPSRKKHLDPTTQGKQDTTVGNPHTVGYPQKVRIITSPALHRETMEREAAEPG